MKKNILSIAMLLLLTACTGQNPDAQCEMKDVKKVAFFIKDNLVNKVMIEEYDIAVDVEAYQETKSIRQDYLEMVNGLSGISSSESLKGTQATKKYTIDFAQVDKEVYEKLTKEDYFGSDLSLSTLVKNHELMGFICK